MIGTNCIRRAGILCRKTKIASIGNPDLYNCLPYCSKKLEGLVCPFKTCCSDPCVVETQHLVVAFFHHRFQTMNEVKIVFIKTTSQPDNVWCSQEDLQKKLNCASSLHSLSDWLKAGNRPCTHVQRARLGQSVGWAGSKSLLEKPTKWNWESQQRSARKSAILHPPTCRVINFLRAHWPQVILQWTCILHCRKRLLQKNTRERTKTCVVLCSLWGDAAL